MSEADERRQVVAIARTWLRTPYHHMARVKGVGVDCATLLLAVFVEAGLVEDFPVPYYAPDFNLHRGAETYLEIIGHYAHEIEGPPLPGDIAVWRFGRCYSHAAIVVEWPMVIHAYNGRTVQLEDAVGATWLNVLTEEPTERPRPRKFFSHWGAA